ncbi:MAG TPA: hypothetical protein VFR09_05665 [Alphaproteobacteria bacterium]|nr:hypothetical protein [Alphaproteobacteria bacterium]
MKNTFLSEFFKRLDVAINGTRKPLYEVDFIEGGEWRGKIYRNPAHNGQLRHFNFDHFYISKYSGGWTLYRDFGSTQEWTPSERTTIRTIAEGLPIHDALSLIQKEMAEARKKTGRAYGFRSYYGGDPLPAILRRLKRGENFDEPLPPTALIGESRFSSTCTM